MLKTSNKIVLIIKKKTEIKIKPSIETKQKRRTINIIITLAFQDRQTSKKTKKPKNTSLTTNKVFFIIMFLQLFRRRRRRRQPI